MLTLNEIHSYQRCPRKQFYESKLQLERIYQPVWWAVNRALREGITLILKDIIEPVGGNFLPAAVLFAREMIERAAARGFDIQNATPQQLLDAAGEAKALVEILLRLAHRLWLPELLKQWEIEAVAPLFEREGITGRPLAVLAPQSLVRHLSGQEQAGNAQGSAVSASPRAILEIGSVSRWDDSAEHRERANRHSLALITLAQRAELRPQQIWQAEKLIFERADALTRPWYSEKAGAYAVEYQQKNYSGKIKRLGIDYKRVKIWERMDLEKWTDVLCQGQAVWARQRLIQRSKVFMPWDVESELNQLHHYQDLIESFPEEGSTEAEFTTDYHWPQNTHECESFSRCQFYDLCHSNVGEPLESGIYQLKAEREEKTDVH